MTNMEYAITRNLIALYCSR